MDKYIFVNGVLPSVSQIGRAIEGLFVVEDWHNFGPDYDKTLVAWFEKFDSNWESLKDAYDERFYRMWKFYLLACAGGFRGAQHPVVADRAVEAGRAGRLHDGAVGFRPHEGGGCPSFPRRRESTT